MNEDDPQNDQIAEIYQRMVHGDKNALGQLQRVQKSPNQKKKSIIMSSEAHNNNNNQQNQSNQLNPVRKSENFRSYVKEKVAELRSAKQGSKKQLVQPDTKTEQKQFRQRKPFSMQKRKNQIISDKKVPAETQTKLLKPTGAISSVPKTKTTNNFQQKMSKQIIKDKDNNSKISSPPSSKNSFRVRPIGGSKKMIEQLLRINEQQKILQSQILDLHNSTKQQIERTVDKYHISQLERSRLTVQSASGNTDNMKGVILPVSIENNIIACIAQKSVYVKNQQEKIERLEKQLVDLDKQLDDKKLQLQKKQAQIQLSPLLQYINVVPDIFQARESQEQNEEVHQLPQRPRMDADPGKTYHSVMGERKKKNWGLSKRTNYEYESVKNQSRITKPGNTQTDGSIFNKSPIHDDGQNKVTVNSRLRQFLFD